jgi:hypothetical protein
LACRQSFTAISEYFRKASVVFFYRGGICDNWYICPQIAEHIAEQDQSFTFCQDVKRELQ